MLKATYKCKTCDKLFEKKFETGGIPFKCECPVCGELSARSYEKIPISKEDEAVSGAIQMMLYSRKPSQN